MRNAALRLMMIGLSSVLLLGLALFALRQLGSSQEYAPLKHPLAAKRQFWLIADVEPNAISAIQTECPECLIQLDIRRSQDGTWLASENKMTALRSSGELLKQGAQTIADILRKYPEQAFVLTIHSRDASQLSSLLEALESRNSQQNLVLNSPYRQILTDARQKRPQWLYGIAPGSITRLLMMESLYIEPMADVWADLFITPLRMNGRSVLSPRLLTELDRREKILILDLDLERDFNSIPQYILESLDGVVTSDVTGAKQFFGL